MVNGASQVALVVKNLPANAGDIRDAGLILGSERYPEGGHSNPLQYPWPGESEKTPHLEHVEVKTSYVSIHMDTYRTENSAEGILHCNM